MSLSLINGNYIARVTCTDSNSGIGITIGFLLNAKAYDALKVKHTFDVQEDRFVYMSDTEYYSIDSLIKEETKPDEV